MMDRAPIEAETFLVTGPTSGIGLASALELARHGAVILVGRNQAKLAGVRDRIEQSGGKAVCVPCDLADPASVRTAVTQIIALGQPITGLLDNAGTMPHRADRNAIGWDLTFTTNYLGPFALTDALLPHLPDHARVLFVASAIEDPERRPAKVMGMKGGRFISIEASARGEWELGGARLPGIDAYATSKQCLLAAALGLAREHPRLRIDAVEPGINPATGLGGANAMARFLFGQIITRLPPFRAYRSTPERAARVIATILTAPSSSSGIYYDEKGVPMTGSSRAHDPAFQDRILVETRAFLARGGQ